MDSKGTLLKVTVLHEQFFCVLWQGYKTLQANECLWCGTNHWNTPSMAVGMKFLTIPGGRVPSGVSHWGCAQLAGKYLSFTVGLCKVRGRWLGKAYSNWYGTGQPPVLGVLGCFLLLLAPFSVGINGTFSAVAQILLVTRKDIASLTYLEIGEPLCHKWKVIEEPFIALVLGFKNDWDLFPCIPHRRTESGKWPLTWLERY